MLFGFVSFSGRLSRLGWILNTIASAVVIYYSLFAIDHLFRRRFDYIPEPTREKIAYALLALAILAVVSFLGASIRRMRDSGSKRPLLASIIALAIPGFGWMYFVLRLLFAGSAAEDDVETKEATDDGEYAQKLSKRIQQEFKSSVPETTKKKKSKSTRRRNLNRAEEFKEQVAASSNKRLRDAAARHVVHGRPGGPTVTRVKRAIPVRSRRQIAF